MTLTEAEIRGIVRGIISEAEGAATRADGLARSLAAILQRAVIKLLNIDNGIYLELVYAFQEQNGLQEILERIDQLIEENLQADVAALERLAVMYCREVSGDDSVTAEDGALAGDGDDQVSMSELCASLISKSIRDMAYDRVGPKAYNYERSIKHLLGTIWLQAWNRKKYNLELV